MISVNHDRNFFVKLLFGESLNSFSNFLDVFPHRIRSINNKADLFALLQASHREGIFIRVLAVSDVHQGVDTFIVFESLSATHIMELYHEVLAIFLLAKYTIIPLPLVVAVFEAFPCFFFACHSTNRLVALKSFVVALNKNAIIILLRPDSATHREELVTVLAARMWGQPTLRRMVKSFFAEFVASWASLLAALRLVFEI